MDCSGLHQFLKDRSNIDEEFIDDFFGLYKCDTTSTDKIIPLQSIANWFGAKKFSLLRTLKTSYKRGLDYTIKKKKSKRGRPKQIVLLTPNCFKRLGMLSKTKKGEHIRDYFIELEQLIDKYKNNMYKKVTRRIKKLERNQKGKQMKMKGVVYILKAADDSTTLYKLGKTVDLKRRLQEHNSSNADNVEVVYTLETKNIDQVEKCAHALMKKYKYRKYKEVYQINADILKDVIELCDCVINILDEGKYSALKKKKLFCLFDGLKKIK